MATLKWWAAMLILCLSGSVALGADLTQESLEKRKQELENEYHYLATESQRLKTFREKMTSEQEKQLYNDWIEALNRDVNAYENKRKAFEKDVDTFQSRQSGASKPATGENQAKATAPQQTPGDQEFTTIRKNLHEREQALNKEFQILMEEKKEIEKTLATGNSPNAPAVEKKMINDLNVKIQRYKEKRKALNAEIDAYNVRVKNASAKATKP